MHLSAKKAGILQPQIQHTSCKHSTLHRTAGHPKPIQSGSFCPSLVSAVLKRLADILCSTVGLILCAPLLFLCSIIVRLDSPGPAFYSQERVTRNEKVFHIYKFRTMSIMRKPLQAASSQARTTPALPGLEEFCETHIWTSSHNCSMF